MDKKPFQLKLTVCAALFIGCCLLSACTNNRLSGTSQTTQSAPSAASIADIPAYSGSSYVVIQDNQPDFQSAELSRESFEQYSKLDALGRCGVAVANIGQDIMPTEKRGTIGQVKPSGWHTVKYNDVDGKYLYNRCHLIGFQLAGENANEKNLITGTRYLNVDGMLPFENLVADYVKETNNHVLYRVTPVFSGKDLVARGVQMEGYSVEDEGEGICFNVFVYNVQPGIVIDYATGESRRENTSAQTETTQQEIRGNRRSKIYHCPGQTAYEDMAHSKQLVRFKTEQEAIDAGYRKAKR